MKAKQLMCLLLFSGALAAEQESELASTIMLCANCHGQAGISSVAVYPNLAGQKALYLKLQLQKFKDGSRPSAVMEPMSKVLSDKEIEALANYYANLSTQVK